MKLATTAIALAVAAALTAACDRPKTDTAYNNSGTNATAPSSSTTTTPTTSPATSDTASSSTASTSATTTMAPGPAGDATGAVSETVTTGKIKAAIAADAGLKDTDISVTTNNGVVMLSGTVKSQDQVAIATNLAQKMDGVQKVEANLTTK
ncbi:MAG TPA: BON domain-containing protein [Usitatibacter sp.]|jgi:hyperosmotically inducible protein|nr:BON domain-containing protein [Usitatibacter sp.]